MNIGDKVRLLRGKEEGIITGFLDNKLLEIEIEDGFKIPVLKSEVVIVASEEALLLGNKELKDENIPERKNLPFSSAGLYIAYQEINDRILSLHLINNTDMEIPYSIGEETGDFIKGLSAGTLKGRTSIKITEYEIKDFEKWPFLHIQALFHGKGIYSLKEPLSKRLKFKASTFFKSKKKAPVIDKDAFLFQLDSDIKLVDPETIKNRLLSNTGESTHDLNFKAKKPSGKVDLHIEQLSAGHAGMSNSEKLDLQLQVFEQELDNAIAYGLDEIIFIHGIGNGILRNEIHKKLSQNTHIKFFQDSMKEKFGYGATLVKIK